MSAKGFKVYVGNLDWKVKWQDLKDHMRRVGEVNHADVFEDKDGRSKGCGIVEFASQEDAKRAIEELQDTLVGDRKIFLREDREEGRDGGYEARGGGGRGGGGGGGGQGGYYQPRGGRYEQRGYEREYSPRRSSPRYSNGGGGGGAGAAGGRGCGVFVGNLPYRFSWQDLKDEFRAAGPVSRAEIFSDASGRSKGCGTVMFDTPEACDRAITMFDGTELAGRVVSVRRDQKFT